MGMRQAINDKCKDCIYDPKAGNGTWREQIAQCTSFGCALWPYRTGPRSGPWADYPTACGSPTRDWIDKVNGMANLASRGD